MRGTPVLPLQVRIKLKHMELEIRRRETTGTGAGAHNETETLAKYEIMDGAPVRGEAVPIRCASSAFFLQAVVRSGNAASCSLCAITSQPNVFGSILLQPLP